MNNFLLIRPPSKYIKERILPPLDLIYVASVLENEGLNAHLFDMLLNASYEELIKVVDKTFPEITVIQCDFINFYECKKIASIVKKLCNKTHLILVGPLPSSFTHKVMKEIPEIDFCIIGEVEKTIVELVNAINKKDSLKKVKGIAFRRKKHIYITQKRPLIRNLDSIPFPDRKLISLNKYKFLPHEFKHTSITTMICSRGCSFKCAFCTKPIYGSQSSPYLFNDDYRVRSPENVISEIKKVVDDYSIKEIFFFDDVFGLKKRWNEKFCNLLIKEKLDLIWSCQTRVDVVNKKTLLKMAKAGCWSILYGLESGNQRLLNLLNKEITINQIKKVIKLTKDSNISVRSSFILGIPTETKQEAIETIKFAKLLNPMYAQFHLLAPFKGTKIYEFCNSLGKKFNETFLDFDTPYRVNFLSDTYDSESELIEMQKFAYRSFYLNPKKIFEVVSKIRSFNQLKSCIGVLKLLL